MATAISMAGHGVTVSVKSESPMSELIRVIAKVDFSGQSSVKHPPAATRKQERSFGPYMPC